jgi:hypothetical protein
MSAHEQVERPEPALPGDAQAASRLQDRLRLVNAEIARRAGGGVTAAFVCECLDRGCVEAVEAPLPVFSVLASAGSYFLVRPGHDEPLGERIVRRESGYVVVERES